MPVTEQRRRHIAKALTWRVAATTTTVAITWIVTGNMKFGLIVGAIESSSKIVLYYLHERAWMRTKFGITKTADE